MRITDADDDYTVTADQRAALMELESLTWNYPTPQPPATSTPAPPRSSQQHYDDDDTDDDDDESYYVELAPYDMTERLKEVNRALVEDPTPAECDRTITVRFREVIADYQSPREYYPSDSDDGYGDSSDLLYDAEDDDAEDGLTTLTPVGNLSVINLVSNLIQDTPEESIDGDSITLDVQKNELMKNKLNDDLQGDIKAEIPKLQLEDKQDEADINKNSTTELISAKERLSYPIPQEESSLLKVNESGLADLESFLRDCEASDISENIPEEFYSIEAEEEVKEEGETVSLVEVSERLEVERGPKSLEGLDTDNVKAEDSAGADKRDTNDVSDTTNLQLPAKSDSDFVSLDYSDDFEEFPDDEEVGITNEKEETKEEKAKPNSSFPTSPVHHGQVKTEVVAEVATATRPSERSQGHIRASSPQKQGHRSRRDLDSGRKNGGSSAERGKKRTDSKSPNTDPPKPLVSTTATRTKPKRSSTTPPMIKPALLNPDKLGSIKPNDQTRHRSRTLPSSTKNSLNGSLTSSSASSSSSSSPLSSASSSTSSSGSSRGRSSSRGSISGPVRPTTVHSSQGVRIPGSPVKSAGPLHHTLPTTTPTTRQAPQARVRKAASASDLHNRVREDSEERKKMNDEVFRSWLRRKDRQAAVGKRHHPKSPTSGRGRPTTEVSERRARAEEAFQAWLARKREQLKLEKRMRGERRRLEDQNRYARSKAECDSAYREWCRRKKDEVRTTARSGGGVPRSQSLERPWVQEKTRKLYSAYLNTH